jgi:hypothetical protein
MEPPRKSTLPKHHLAAKRASSHDDRQQAKLQRFQKSDNTKQVLSRPQLRQLFRTLDVG